MTESWWAPREIVFSREQIEWLLRHLLALDEGQWPTQPGGYDDVKTNKPDWWKGAYFETPCQFGAEVRYRLEATGDDGLLVLLCHTYETALEQVARMKSMDVPQVARRIERALRYMAGWSRKDYPYKAFVGRRWKRQ